jgi:L-seryl-tRNA(Ser) seleniumtransferase
VERDRAEQLRALPPAHALLESSAGRDLARALPHEAARAAVRRVLEALRGEVLAGHAPGDRAALTRRALELLETEATRARIPRLRPVINATGVVLHTNLGRAPLGGEVLDHVARVSRGYATLEYDLAQGRRGHRDRLISELCASLVGAEDALVVNNNAAAVLLAATALAAGREVVISRGELVEIGGGFRVPEIIAACGARLVEVGTTNRTRAADYERALTPATAMILKVHRSNFALLGFTAEASVRELAAVARARGVPLVEDIGSGALVDTRALGLPAEPMPRASIAEGADVVMFSGDKLMGGPQAGLIAGRRAWIDTLRRHPLARAMRPGRIVLAALEATLRIYAEGRAREAIPALAMLGASVDEVRARAEALAEAARALVPGEATAQLALERTEARVGGGSMPAATLPSWALAVRAHDDAHAARIERALREHGDPPVIARIAGGRVLLDARTISDVEIAAAACGLARALARAQEMQVHEAPGTPGAEQREGWSEASAGEPPDEP